jgi:hypothetical protein
VATNDVCEKCIEWMASVEPVYDFFENNILKVSKKI